MTIGTHSIGETPLAAQADHTTKGRSGPPPKRTIVANSDAVVRPEAR